MNDEKTRSEQIKEKTWLSDDLKPCPFCGNDKIYYERYRTDVGMRFRVICGKCCAKIDDGCAQNRYTVKELWNTRNYKDGE